MSKTYTVTFKVEGYYETQVEAENEAMANEIANSELADTVDFGELSDVDWKRLDTAEDA